MRYGCCLNMVAKDEKGVGYEYLPQLAEAGYDYAELPLAEIMRLSPGEFQLLLKKKEEAGVPCEVCNNFFPASMRLTGGQVQMDLILSYVEQALTRAELLGVENVVFGSGGAKNVPKGFSLEQGYSQVVTLLKKIAPIAASHGITIVIEPLRQQECNLINTFSEGVRLAKDVDHEAVKVLVDFFHLRKEKEALQHLELDRGRWLRHVHFANPDGRVYPKKKDESWDDYLAFLKTLKSIGYDARISMEAYSENFFEDAREALGALKNISL